MSSELKQQAGLDRTRYSSNTSSSRAQAHGKTKRARVELALFVRAWLVFTPYNQI